MPDGSIVSGTSRSTAQVVRLQQPTRFFPDGTPAIEFLDGMFWREDRTGRLYRRGASLEELLAEAGGQEAKALLAAAEEAREKVIAAGGKAPRRREKQFIPLKFAPYPVRVERIVIDEGAEPGRRAEGLEFGLALESLSDAVDGLSSEIRRGQISIKNMMVPGELSAVLGGLPGCVKGTGLDRQVNVILGQRGHFRIPIVRRPAGSGFSETADGAPRYVLPDRTKQTVMLNGVPHIIDEDGTTTPDIIDYERLDSETVALGAAEQKADPLLRLPLLRGLRYRGSLASIVAFNTFTALVGAAGSDSSRTGETGAGKTLSAKHAAGLPLTGQVNFRFSGLSKPGVEARLRGLRDTTIVGDDFNYSDHGSPTERQRINELIGMVGRAAYDGSEMRGLSTREGKARRGVEVCGHMLLTGERFDPDAGLLRRMVLFRYRQGECNWPDFVAEWDRWQTVHDDTFRAIIHYVLRQLATPEGKAELAALISELDDATWLETRLAARFPTFDGGVLRDVAANYAKGVSGLRLAALVRGDEMVELAAEMDAAEHHAASLIEETRNTAARDIDEMVLRDFIRWALHGHAYLFAWETGRQLEDIDPRIADCGYRPSPGEAGAWVTNGGTRLGWIRKNDDVLFNGPAAHSLLQAYARVTRIPLALPATKLADLFVRLQLAERDLSSGRNTQVHSIGGIDERGVFIPANRDIFDRSERSERSECPLSDCNIMGFAPTASSDRGVFDRSERSERSEYPLSGCNLMGFAPTASSDRAVISDRLESRAVGGKTADINGLEYTPTAPTAPTAGFAPFVPPTAPTAWAKRPRAELGSELMGWGKFRGYPLLWLQTGAGGRDTVRQGEDEWRLFARTAAPDELAAALRAAQLSASNTEGFSSVAGREGAEDPAAAGELVSPTQAETSLPAAPGGAGCGEADRPGFDAPDETGPSASSAEALAAAPGGAGSAEADRPGSDASDETGPPASSAEAPAAAAEGAGCAETDRPGSAAPAETGPARSKPVARVSSGSEPISWQRRVVIDTETLCFGSPNERLTVVPLPEQVRPGAEIGAIVALAIELQARQLWLHHSWTKAAKFPRELPPDATDRDGFIHAWASGELPPSCHLFKPDRLKFWMRAYRKGESGSIAIAVPALEGRTDWRKARNARELLETLLLLERLGGARYQSGPGSWYRMVIQRSRRKGAFDADLAPSDFPLPWRRQDEDGETFNIAPMLSWERPLLESERHHRYVWQLDNNKNYVAAANRLRLPLGVPVLQTIAFDPKLAGCWKARVIGEPAHAGLLPHPCYRRRLTAGSPASFDEPAWYTTSQLASAHSLGCQILVEEAWIYPQSAPMLEQTYRVTRDAFYELDRLELAGDRSAIAAATVFKDSYTRGLSSLDMVHERDGDEPIALHRPDWYAEVRAAGGTLILRQLHKAANFSGRTPFAISVDACYFTSDQSDPIAAAAEIGLPLGRRLGVFKPDGFAQLSDLIPILDEGDHHLPALSQAMREPKNRTAIRRALEQADIDARTRAAARRKS